MIKKSQRARRKRRNSKFPLAILLLSISLVVLIFWGLYELDHPKASDNWFEFKSEVSDKINLPKDDAPHQAKMEWWYYNGRLKTKSGNEYSFHYADFVVNGLISHVVSHVSLTNLQTGQNYIDQQRTNGALAPVDKTANQFNFVLGNWLMSGSNGKDHLKVSSKDFSFDLNLHTNLNPLVHGYKGLLNLGAAGSSYYYSRTRMIVLGTVKIGNTTEKVDGLVWFDHQWGDFLTTQLSWDWFSLQLNDGSDVMIYNIKDKANKPVLITGTVKKNGVADILVNSDFTIEPKKKWISHKTGISYPIGWQIKVPKKNIDISVDSIINNNEFDAKLTTYNVYWEGAINVHGSHSGQGFMELNGYTESKL